MSDFSNKTQSVLHHLKKYKSITSWEAITKYRATRLSAIIFNLKKKCYEFKTITEYNPDTDAHYARYYLVGSPNNANIKNRLEQFQAMFMHRKKV